MAFAWEHPRVHWVYVHECLCVYVCEWVSEWVCVCVWVCVSEYECVHPCWVEGSLFAEDLVDWGATALKCCYGYAFEQQGAQQVILKKASWSQNWQQREDTVCRSEEHTSELQSR